MGLTLALKDAPRLDSLVLVAPPPLKHDADVPDEYACAQRAPGRPPLAPFPRAHIPSRRVHRYFTLIRDARLKSRVDEAASAKMIAQSTAMCARPNDVDTMRRFHDAHVSASDDHHDALWHEMMKYAVWHSLPWRNCMGAPSRV